MPKVAIFGGGVGGLTTAHELVERGFEVEVYDIKKKLWGGKARSIGKPDSGVDGRLNLPGEHGFRFFPGFYKHLPDTMQRIPFPGNENGCLGNLVETTQFALYRENGEPIVAPVNFPETLAEWKEALHAVFGSHVGVGKLAALFFVKQVLKLACSCQDRMDEEFDNIDWWDYVEAPQHDVEYQRILAEGLTRSLVAMQAQVSSTRTVGTMLLQLLYNMLTPGVQSDRVLNGPTNEMWIDPWVNYLTGKGVKMTLKRELKSFNMDADGKKLRSVTLVDVTGEQGEKEVVADYYVSAVPTEKMAKLLTLDMLKAAPDMAGILALTVKWMNGIQFFLDQPFPIVHGHAIYVDSSWALTSISQQQFWNGIDLSKYGNGQVRGVLSVDVSDWFAPGEYTTKKTADDCTAQEIAAEVWAQLVHHLDEDAKNQVEKVKVIDWFLDPDIYPTPGHKSVDENKEPLLINMKGSLKNRPPAVTGIPNLFLASDYVNTYTNLACMEGANEAGRRAVNGILDAENSDAERCQLWPYETPAVFVPLQAADQLVWDLTHSKKAAAAGRS